MYKKLFLAILITILASGCSIRKSSESVTDAAKALETINGGSDAALNDNEDNDNGSNTSAVEPPIVSPSSTSFNSQLTFEITHNDPSSVEIYYTMNGVDPTESDNHCASFPCQVTISTSKIIKVAAFKNGDMSVIRKRTYLKDSASVAATPVFNPTGGFFSSPRTVSISSQTAGAVIRYTMGSSPVDPDCVSSGSIYSTPITVSALTTIKAIACKSGLTQSVVKAETYVINSSATQVATPVITPTSGERQPVGGMVGAFVDHYISIATSTPSATIVYTVDGATPACPSTGTVINNPAGNFVIHDSATSPVTHSIKAIACKSGMQDSALVSITYKILPMAPTFTPATGASFNSLPQNITILKSASDSGWMCYSTSGTPNCTCSPQVTNDAIIPLATAGLTTVRAVACNAAGSSAVATATYNLQAIANPTITPTSGSFCKKATITISAPGADTIRIRTTNSALTCTSNYEYVGPIIYEPLYPSGPLMINTHGLTDPNQFLYISGTYIKAIACKNGIASGVTYIDLSSINIVYPPAGQTVCTNIADEDLSTAVIN